MLTQLKQLMELQRNIIMQETNYLKKNQHKKKWEIAKYFIDCKKDIDSIMFIAENVRQISNLNLKGILDSKLRDFYIKNNDPTVPRGDHYFCVFYFGFFC